MVALKPAKGAKHTYAERVLQAFSQARKHRRHIHLATLRAQVKKNAESQRDKLGPQWSSWVSKAVHRLENEGILSADSSGSITMTPTGKKAVTAARKSLSIPNSTPSAAQEEAIWRNIAHTPSTPSARRASKRPRYSTTQAAHEYLDDGDDDFPSTPTPHRSARAKRARPSVSSSKSARPSISSGKKPVSQMTKAELKAALKALETEHANLLMRETSPLTDIDAEEERDRLKSELKTRDQELERVRRELNEVRGQTVSSGTHDFDMDRPSSPAFHTSTSSPPPVESPDRRPCGGVTRTQSGSLIYDVSKRPTPAPSSSSGADWDGENENIMDGGNSASISGLERHRPVMTNKERDTDLTAEISRLKALMDRIKKENDKRGHVDGEKISGLEKTLAARITEVQKYKELHAELSEQVSELEGKIADRDFRVSFLEQEIQTLRSDLSSAVAKDTELKNIYISKEASLSARLHELERTAGQYEEAMQSLSTEKADCLEKLGTAQRQLQQAEEVLTRFSKRIALSEEEAEHLRADLARARLELGHQEDQAQLLRTESEAHKTRVSDLREALARQEAELASLTLQLEESLSQRTSLAEQCASKDASLSMSQASLVNLQARATSFDLTLAERDSKVTELTEKLADVGAENHGLRDRITSLESAMGDLRNDLGSATSCYSELGLAYQLKSDECNNLSIRIQEVEGNVANLSGALSRAKDDAEALSQSLERARDGENTWRDALRQAEALHEEHAVTLSAEVKQLRTELSVSELNAKEYMEKTTEKTTHLRKQVAEAQGRIQEVEHALHVAEAQYSAERATHESTATAMEESLTATRQEIDSLSLQIMSAQTTHSKLQDELYARTRELSEVRASLHAESQRVTALKAEVAVAISRASDAEEDILDLRSSKQADERTIDLLRESFAKLREVQMQSLAELNDKVHSAHSTPVSKRRLNA